MYGSNLGSAIMASLKNDLLHSTIICVHLSSLCVNCTPVCAGIAARLRRAISNKLNIQTNIYFNRQACSVFKICTLLTSYLHTLHYTEVSAPKVVSEWHDSLRALLELGGGFCLLLVPSSSVAAQQSI